MQTITVMQVFRSLNIVPEPSVSWSVGAQMATLYKQRHGEQPPKDNRPKTSGGGTHCFAIYPRSWEREIAAAILAHEQARKEQQDLFA